MPFLNERILGGLWGAAAGDALGVPAEFLSREEMRRDPVKDMRGFGSHQQPAGTWSDDTSLMLCTVESLLGGFDTTDLGQRFVAWQGQGHWTAQGEPFDINLATSDALLRIESGTPPELAGGTDELSNGTGSLMRVLPIALWRAESPMEDLLDAVHRAASLTHRHPRAVMAGGYYALLLRSLYAGLPPFEAYRKAGMEFRRSYGHGQWADQLAHFHRLLTGDLPQLPEEEIRSGGHTLHTLEAGLWCLLNTRRYTECVLRAVNLGDDTDTTGAVAGGLAGVHYGLKEIPAAWREQLARQDEMAGLFARFAESLEKMP
jgi:ADP-ribosyl-[dinitrogen reductase] hydrolase